jgi:hypothetical protein
VLGDQIGMQRFDPLADFGRDLIGWVQIMQPPCFLPMCPRIRQLADSFSSP